MEGGISGGRKGALVGGGRGISGGRGTHGSGHSVDTFGFLAGEGDVEGRKECRMHASERTYQRKHMAHCTVTPSH